jgi:hypothetical protein
MDKAFKLHDLHQGLSAGRRINNAQQHSTANAAPAQAGSHPHSLLFTRFTSGSAAAPVHLESHRAVLSDPDGK